MVSEGDRSGRSDMAKMTLTEFLLARIAEDEAQANRSKADAASGKTLGVPPGWITGVADRVLAECEAKRRIVDAIEDERQRMDIYNRDYDLGLLTTEGDLRSGLASNARWAGLDMAARALASAYADHPDYREEWRI